MKRFERFLVPMVMVGILVLSGCASLTSTSTSGKVALPLIAGVDGTKTIIGKIIEIMPVLFVHSPRYAFCRIHVVSDNGDKPGFFVPRATIITDLSGKDISGKWPRVGERVEVKYYTLEPGVDDRTYTVSIRYVPSDYVQKPTASMTPEKTAPSTSVSTLGPTSAPSVATSGFHKVQGFGPFGPIPLQTCIPVYQGEPPKDYPYKDLGPVKGAYTTHFMEGSHASRNKAFEDIANNAKAMNANAVIKIQPHMGFSGNTSVDGEAVIFDVMPKE